MASKRQAIAALIFVVSAITAVFFSMHLFTEDGYFFSNYYQDYESHSLVRLVNTEDICAQANHSPGAEHCSDAYGKAENILFITWFSAIFLAAASLLALFKPWPKRR